MNNRTKTRDQLVAIDLGGRTTKAIHVQHKDGAFVLNRYVLVDAPISEKTPSVESWSDHLKTVWKALETKTRSVSLAIGLGDSIVRNTELPQMRLDDMRLLLKNNTKTYLQQELPGHVFDCALILGRPSAASEDMSKAGNVPKQKVLVAGAKQQFVNDLQTATKNAGLIADHMVPALVCPLNAFELAMPELFRREAIALVDIGFKMSSICLVQEGELILSRALTIGGDRLTNGLAESMGISYAEAEGIKQGMPAEVQDQLQALVSPLGRELRASIEFFEHQQDRAVAQVFVSGGSAQSDFILKALQAELLVECKSWNPVGFMQLGLPPQQVAELEQAASQLTVAVGAAITTF